MLVGVVERGLLHRGISGFLVFGGGDRLGGCNHFWFLSGVGDDTWGCLAKRRKG